MSVIRSLKKVRSPPSDLSARFDLTRRSSIPRARLCSHAALLPKCAASHAISFAARRWHRSEEHTSELQSLMRISYAVFCLKKKKRAKAKQCTTSNKDQQLNSNNKTR